MTNSLHKNNISDYFKGCKRNSKYKNKGPQQPKRMYVDKTSVDIPTEDAFDKALLSAQMENSSKKEDNLVGCRLYNRHRYGDQLDILKKVFTLTAEEVETEKFKLIMSSMKLIQRIHWSGQKVPKHEKYVLYAEIRTSGYTVLKHSVSVKKRYYRKNLLEMIDVELEILRNHYFMAHTLYPKWIDRPAYLSILEDINITGKLVGGLLKTTVV